MIDLSDRHRAAAKAGLPAELAPRLQGENLTELEADAEQLARVLRPRDESPDASRTAVAANQAIEAARTRRLFGKGDGWKQAGDE